MLTVQGLALIKEKIFSDINIEMLRQGYTTADLAELLNIKRYKVKTAIHGGEKSEDFDIRSKIYRILGMD